MLWVAPVRSDLGLAALAVALLLAGCSDDVARGDGDADCWPIEGAETAGAVQLGTGAPDFEPLGDRLQFQRGLQGGVHLPLNALMQGLEPGNAGDLFAAENPRTRFQAIMPDGSLHQEECPATVGYLPVDGEWLELAIPFNLQFVPAEIAEPVFDTELTIVVEIIDATGGYARDERTVFCAAPAPL